MAAAASRFNYAYPPLALPLETIETIQSFLRTVILCLIAGAAVASREFAVVRFESIIHECGRLPRLLPAHRLTVHFHPPGSIHGSTTAQPAS